MGSTRNRRRRDPEIVIARDTDSELSSSEEEGEEENNYPLSESEEEEDEAVKNGGKIELQKNKAKGKAPITVKLIKKVCKQPGHEAGFKGATYINCPMKPCFLCKIPGHTTMSCPHRVVTDHGILPTSHRNTKNHIDFVFKRQLQPRIPPIKPKYVIPDQVHCAELFDTIADVLHVWSSIQRRTTFFSLEIREETRVSVIGNLTKIPESLLRTIHEVEEATKSYKNKHLIL